ncbi:MAG: hypothetical protein ABIY62_01585 [Ginsengibacter sp.]
MKEFLKNFYFSFPIQLFLLHFRKSQALLIFWFILFLTITGNFMKIFGANALFLAPEYLGSVNAASAAITGVAAGVYIMSWNITTFILHSMRFRFLATTSKPFLKYCLNNAIIPVCFLILYFFETFSFDRKMELIPTGQLFAIAGGFAGGFFLLIAISFAYFFTADRRIIRTFKPGSLDFDEARKSSNDESAIAENGFGLPVGYYLTARFRFRKARTVAHYSQEFLDTIFKRHHISAIITIIIAFLFMILIGFFLDNKFFQVPAAASILVFFALLIAAIGALNYFLRSWSVLFVIFLFIVLNVLYKYNIIDPRNKAFGLDYSKKERPHYSLQHLQELNSPQQTEADKKNMLGILNRWKAKQDRPKPLMIVFNFNGGGVRSATFAMNILEQLDSLSKGSIMTKTALISGASGGMLAAAYFRELTRLRNAGEDINLQDRKYINYISRDLLNPIFSSMISRDLLSPAQKFSVGPYRYVKDRGYAFEQKLNANTRGILDKSIGAYKEDEENATIPLMILNSVITRDLKKMMISTQPISFMMQPAFIDSGSAMSGPDAVDFATMFKNENPMNLRLLTALRMNATYPYILPSVWLPSKPVIDVMDAGLRDNYGQETSLRFLYVFKDWIRANTSGVLIIQIRSMQKGSWATPYENGGILDIFTKPFSMLQVNWFRLQDYFQDDEITYAQNLDSNFHRVAFMYIPEMEERGATLNFHLTASEKKEVIASAGRKNNVEAFKEVEKYLKN